MAWGGCDCYCASTWACGDWVLEPDAARFHPCLRLAAALCLRLQFMGKKIQCTIFGGDKEVLKDTLKVFHTYSITNINTIPGDYRVIDNELQWSLSARTLIEGISVPTLTVRSLKYKFVPLIKLEDYCKDTQGFDVLFAGINVDPKRPANDAFVLHVTAIDQGFQTFNQRIVHFHLQSANA